MENLTETKPDVKSFAELINEVDYFVGFVTTEGQKNSEITKSVHNVSTYDIRKLAEWYDCHLHEPDNEEDYFFIMIARKNYAVLITTKKS